MNGLEKLVFLACAAATAHAEPLLPTAEGTSWLFQMTQELGKGVTFSDLKADADGKVHLPVTYRVGGEQTVDGKQLHKYEMHRAGVVSNTDLLTVDENAVTCYARISEQGELIKLDPPQKMLVAPVRVGTKWDYKGKIEDMDVRQEYKIAAEEDIEVPAGKFHAFRVHCEQTAPISIAIDRWFVPRTGFVKDVTTMTTPNAQLLQRISLELKSGPTVMDRPEVKATAAPKKISVGLASELTGEATTQFPSKLPKIFARWQGNGLPAHAKIRAVWIADDVGDVAPAGYKISEAATTATGADSFGTFTLSRPTKGWPLGKYHLDLYVNDAAAVSAPFTISD